MYSLGVRSGVRMGVDAVQKTYCGVGPLFVQRMAIAAVATSAGPLTISSRRAWYGHERPNLLLGRGLATEVDRMQHNIRVKEGMSISDPVKRVLAIENASR